ncbi:MAG: hypothetical protein ABIJ33_04995 [Patescibacteria group bacterium]
MSEKLRFETKPKVVVESAGDTSGVGSGNQSEGASLGVKPLAYVELPSGTVLVKQVSGATKL